MPKKKPEFKTVKFGEIKVWGKNPRQISPEKLQMLARSLKKYGLFQNLTCWMEDERYVTGGGNMRYKAMREVLKWKDDAPVQISVNFPESEAEKLELSFLDNQTFRFYNELEVANLIKPEAGNLDLDMLAINVALPIDLDTILTDFDDEQQKVPVVDDLFDNRKRSGRVFISADLNIVGIGAYTCVISRVTTDRVVELLVKQFGNNRSQRQKGGEWVCKLILDALIPKVGNPSGEVLTRKAGSLKRKKEKAEREKAENEEYQKFKREREKKEASGKK